MDSTKKAKKEEDAKNVRKVMKPKSPTVAKPASLSFPGVPSKNPGAMVVHGVKIYTSIVSMRWRCLPEGERVDTAFSWKHNPRASWNKLVKFVTKHKSKGHGPCSCAS